MEHYIVWKPLASTRSYVSVDCIKSDKSIEEIETDYKNMGIVFPKVTLYSDDEPKYDLDPEYHNILVESEI